MSYLNWDDYIALEMLEADDQRYQDVLSAGRATGAVELLVEQLKDANRALGHTQAQLDNANQRISELTEAYVKLREDWRAAMRSAANPPAIPEEFPAQALKFSV
jgi:chromosome segregation ATPase